jgi:hypothetical protein
MAVKVLLLFLCISLAFAGCKNEPYDTGELSVISFVNKEAGGAAQTFGYKAGRLNTYSSKSTTINRSMLFYYHGDQLQFITSDSTGTSFTRTNLYYDGLTVVDSTFLYPRDSIYVIGLLGIGDSLSIVTDTTFVSTRAITYGTDGKPTQVKTTTWNDDVQTDEQVDITWTNGNVSRLFTTTTTAGSSVLKDVIAEYDDKNGIYSKRKEYIYAVPTKDIFWLSTNNPVMFNDGTGEKNYSYSYNRLGYPAAYTSSVGTKYGLTYNQVL